MRRLPCSPWRAHLEQVRDRIRGGSHAGGGGYVLKELWPTLERRKSVERGAVIPHAPVPVGLGSRHRVRNGGVKLSLGKRGRGEVFS